MSVALFGPLVDDDLIERGVIQQLQRWLPTYMSEWGARRDTELLEVASWNPVSQDPEERWPEHHLPAIVVVCPGLHDEPVKHGDGSYDITVQVAVAAVVAGADEHQTRQLAHWYAALCRWTLLQQTGFEGTDLEGLVDGVRWLANEPVADPPRRTLGAKTEVLVLELSDVMNSNVGPDVPEPDTDHDSPHTAETVEVDVVDQADE